MVQPGGCVNATGITRYSVSHSLCILYTKYSSMLAEAARRMPLNTTIYLF